MKKYLNEGHFGLVLGTTAFIYFLYTGLTRDKITSDNDLVEVKGKYLRHSFKDVIEYKNSSHQYYIWTEEYSNAFQVKADYLGIFNGRDFITKIKRGDEVIFTIPKRLINKLNSADNVFVTSIQINRRTYLNKNETLDIERHLATSNADYYIGTMYLVVGLFVYFRRRLRQAKTTANKSYKPLFY